MQSNDYSLRYLPLFYNDLEEIVEYISVELNNPDAARRLIDAVENAILERKSQAESFEIFPSKIEREYPYYRIYVANFIVYYVVIHNGDERIMEVRRILYNKRNMDFLLL